jgi:hypothetical protein
MLFAKHEEEIVSIRGAGYGSSGARSLWQLAGARTMYASENTMLNKRRAC